MTDHLKQYRQAHPAYGLMLLFSRAIVQTIAHLPLSNPGLSLNAALVALNAARCKGRKILIMADMLELGKQKELLHRQIAWSITNTCDLLIAVGSLARITAQAARQNGLPAKHIFCCANAFQARDLLFKKILPGADDLILVMAVRESDRP